MKIPVKHNKKEKTLKFTHSIPPDFLFICGLVTVPAFLLQTVLFVRIFQVLLFLLLVVISGRKVKLLFHVMLFLSIALMNILTPCGEVLLKIGPLPVTHDALNLGIFKATTFLGLIYLSQFTISTNLKLPGVIGGTMGKVFFYFEKIKQENRACTNRNLIERIDFILFNVLKNPENMEIPAKSIEKGEKKLFGIIFLCFFVLINWGAFIIVLLYGANIF